MLKTNRGRRFVTDYLKIPEVARRLDVSEKTARRYIKAGVLPSTFIGGAYRVTEEDLEEFLHRAEVKPEAPKAESRSSLEPSLFNGVLAEERRERLIQSVADYALSRAARWEVWLAQDDRELLGEMVVEYDALRHVLHEALQPPLGTEAIRALDRLNRTMDRTLERLEHIDAEAARQARALLERWSA
jgi:excisionase family DNA binding protein